MSVDREKSVEECELRRESREKREKRRKASREERVEKERVKFMHLVKTD